MAALAPVTEAKAELKLNLLFSDIMETDFSPKVVSPPASYRVPTGQTPKVMTFRMFGDTEVFKTSLSSRLSSNDDPILPADRASSRSNSARNSLSSDIAVTKRKSYDDRFNSNRVEIDLQEDDDENPSEKVADDTVDGGNPSSNEICPYFLRGGCRFRKNCRLSHSIGLLCPYCNLDLPQTWTQQSKHLKRCWESGVELEELETSKDLQCDSCRREIVANRLNFALLQECQHPLCVLCAERLWNPITFNLPCPTCAAASSVVMVRDRMFFDADRKSKMFGIFQKKMEVKRQRAVIAAGQAAAGYRSHGGSRRSSNADSNAYPKKGRSNSNSYNSSKM